MSVFALSVILDKKIVCEQVSFFLVSIILKSQCSRFVILDKDKDNLSASNFLSFFLLFKVSVFAFCNVRLKTICEQLSFFSFNYLKSQWVRVLCDFGLIRLKC